jgi:hypothetical protein
VRASSASPARKMLATSHRRRGEVMTPAATRCGVARTPIPTISCIFIRLLPQVLGRRRPIWYPANAALDRHT